MPPKTLKSSFPEKTVDDEWGVEWQGAIFTMHVGYDGDDGDVVRVDDEVTVLSRKRGGAGMMMEWGVKGTLLMMALLVLLLAAIMKQA